MREVKKRAANATVAEKKLQGEEQERAEEHEPPAKPMDEAPGRGTFQSPGSADADKIIRTQISRVIPQHREEKQKTPADDVACCDAMPERVRLDPLTVLSRPV